MDFRQRDCVARRERLREHVTIRVGRTDRARLTALGRRIPVMSENAIARTALRIGIDMIERDPSTILQSGNEAASFSADGERGP